MEKDKEYFMSLALREAKKAYLKGEAPIGAVIVKDGKVLARAHNLRETRGNALAHAELLAIGKACKRLGDWRLNGADLYVTLEPCPMCAGAVIQSRISRIFFGAFDPKAGAAGSKLNMFADFAFNHTVEYEGGVLGAECAGLLTSFFKELRNQDKN